MDDLRAALPRCRSLRRSIVAEVTLALTWLSVALGLISKSVETASNLPRFLIPLPFLGSGFVPTEYMSAGLSIELVRRIAAVHPRHGNPPRTAVSAARSATARRFAVCWCVGIALVSHLWAKRLFNRRPAG